MMEMGLGFVSSDSAASSTDSPTESLNGLKFGHKIYFEDTAAVVGPSPPKTAAAPSKKPRSAAVPQTGHPPRCQVEGCKADLSDVKAYYSRHKVCGMHSKTPKVIVAGLEQRFCQQCSRFHLLSEFDQGKRSCRRRLAGHNERRRKPPPGSLLSSRYSRITSSIIESSSRSGGVMVDFSAYSRLPGRDSWPLVRPPDEHVPVSGDSYSARPHSHPQIWQNDSENPHQSNTLFHSSGSGTSLCDSVIPHGECFTDSSRALSLLSNQLPWASRNRASSIGENNVITSDGIAMVQPTQPPVSAVMNTNWGLMKGNDSSSGSGMLLPNLGSGQPHQPVRGQFFSELESSQPRRRHYMELQDSRAYDTSAQHINWSL